MSIKRTESMEINCVPDGIVRIPPSKSLSHRALICGALAGKGTIIKKLGRYGEDVAATLACLAAMGLDYRLDESGLTVARGIVNTEGIHVEEGKVLDCGESGSTLRFLIPFALLSGAPVVMTGRGRLLQRPLKSYLEALASKGGKSCLEEQRLYLQGPLRPGIYEIPGNVSSQFISGLLMALPLLGESSEIRLTTGLESKPYVNITIDVMKHFGVHVEALEDGAFRIPGGQSYTPAIYEIEGDYSAGAYFLVAGALGCDVGGTGLKRNSLQGDAKILDFILRCGGEILHDEDGALRVRATELHGITADISQCPDLAPPLAVLLCFCKGRSKIGGASRLRMKESDRLRSITQAMNSLGASIEEGEDYLLITGVDVLEGGVVDPHNDHRIAMAAALASLKSRGKVTILDPRCVNKSYPDFWKDFCRKEKEESI